MIYIDKPVDVDLKYSTPSGECVFMARMNLGEILLFALVIYASKGNYERPVLIRYVDLNKLKKYKMDVSLLEFKNLGYGLRLKQYYFKPQILGPFTTTLFLDVQVKGAALLFTWGYGASSLLNVEGGRYLMAALLQLFNLER